MTNCALKVLAACPKSLLDLGVLTEFDSDGGVVLVESKNKLDNAISSWGGSDFNKKEASKYAESLEYLHARKAIVEFSQLII